MKINFAKIINKNIKQNKKEFSLSKQKIIFFIIFLIINSLISIKYSNPVDFNKISNNFEKYFTKRYQYQKMEYNNYIRINHNNKFYKLSYNNSNVAICSIAKQENLYIKEFVEYYRNLGIKKIFLYDNNELKGENFKEVLSNHIYKDFIEIKNYRGMISPQKKAYTDCYINNNNKFDWIAFYDIDEFLYLENYSNINDFLSLPKFKKCSSILINWKYYGDNNNIYYETKPLKNRFTQPFIFLNNKKYDKYFYSAAKSIIRTGLNLSWAHFPHFINDSMICRADGTIVNDPFSAPQYSYAYIKHFATKSTEEYITKLFKGNVNSFKSLDLNAFLYWINNYYFLFNKKTKQKILFIKKILKFNIFRYVKE